MAVAVKNPPETVTPMTLNRLAVVSLTGVVFVLGSIGVVFYGVPTLWHHTVGVALANVSFINYALLGVVMLAVAGGLAYLGQLLGGTELPPGGRAGIGMGALGFILLTLITMGVGAFLQTLLPPDSVVLGLAVTGLVGLGLLFVLVRLYLRPDADRMLTAVEEQGWFTLAPYKKTQGQRVRRGTLLGLLAIAGCGVWVLIDHKTLEIPEKHWILLVPFTSTEILLLRDVRFTVPILLAFGALWLAYRVVNFPMFADFLIATEAELNKVSWASRKRLVQDTVVVLTTVVLVTAFIFFVDIFWGWSLQQVGVLQLPEKTSQESKLQDW